MAPGQPEHTTPPAASAYTAGPANNGDWFDARGAAAYLPGDRSERYVHRQIRLGHLRATILDARGAVAIHRRWLDAFLARGAGVTRSPRYASAKQPDGHTAAHAANDAGETTDRNGERNQ